MKTHLNIFFLVFLLPLSLFAQLDRSKRPEPGPAPIIQLGKAESFKLNNGLQVFVVENHKLPRVSYSLILDYEPFMEGEYAGFSSIAGQMLRTATSTRSKEQIDEAIDFIGASLSTSARGVNASGLKKHNEQILELMADVVVNPKFLEEELEKIKTQTISGLAASKNNPDAIMGVASKKVAYGAMHPYGESETDETIKNISLEACEAFYQAFYRPNVAYMAIVGDITLAEAKTLVEKYFSKWQPSQVPQMNYQMPQPPAKRQVSIVDRPTAVQSAINVTYAIDLKPDAEDAIAASIMNTILGGAFFRLNENLREKHAFTYGAYSTLSPDKTIGRFTASTSVRNSATDSAVAEIVGEMARLVNEPVPQEELTRIKNYIMGNFALSLESPQTIARFALNQARYGLPDDYYANYLRNVEAITSADVQRAAQRYLLPENCHIVVVGKAADIAGGLQKLAMDGQIHFIDEQGNKVEKAAELKAVPAGMTAQKVLKNYFAAIGGEKQLKKMKDMTQIASTTVQGMNLELITYQKAPNKMLIETKMQGMTVSKQLFDGQKGIVQSMMGREELQGEMLEEFKLQSVLNLELYYNQYGVKTELLGIETIKGAEHYKMKTTSPSGKESIHYFDVATGLKTRSIGENGVTDMSDYRNVGKIKFPFKISSEMGPMTLDIEVKEVKVNQGLKDDVFAIN